MRPSRLAALPPDGCDFVRIDDLWRAPPQLGRDLQKEDHIGPEQTSEMGRRTTEMDRSYFETKGAPDADLLEH